MRRSSGRRLVRICPTVILALAVSTCVDGNSPTGITADRTVRLSFETRFATAPSATSSAAIDQLGVRAREAETGEVLGSTEVDVRSNDTEWEVAVQVEIPSDREAVQVYVEVELLDGGIVAWSGRIGPLDVGTGSVTEPTPVEVYPGPLDNLGVVSVSIDAPTTSLQLLVEGTVTLGATYEVSAPSLEPVIVWTSSDPSVATVEPTGVVTGVAAGQAEIVAAAGPAADTIAVEVLASAPDREWVGGVSGAEADWSEPGNWSPEGVPTASAGALIPGTAEFIPVLTANASVGDLTIEAGAEVDLAGYDITVTGSLQANGPVVSTQGTGAPQVFMTGTGATLAGSIGHSDFPLQRIVVDAGADVALAGRTDVWADVDVLGHLSLGSDTLNANSTFSTTGTDGVLEMTSASAHLSVTGDAEFGGGSTFGLLTAGTMELRGSLFVYGVNAVNALYASDQHRVVFANSTPQVLSVNPAASSSIFQHVGFANTDLVEIQGAALIFGIATVLPGASVALGTGAEILVGQDMDQQGNMTLTGDAALSVTGNLDHSGDLSVGVSASVGVGNTLTRATGSNMVLDGTASALVCLNRGGTLTLNGTLDCPMQVDSPTHTWSGALSGDWSTADNWEEGTVPGIEQHVWIPEGAPNAPVIADPSVAVSQLDVHPYTSLELGSGTVLRVLAGIQAGVGTSGGIIGAGTVESAGGSIQGSLPNLVIDGIVTLSNVTLATGDVTVRGGQSLDIAGNYFEVTGALTIENSVDPVDHLILGQSGGSVVVRGTFTVGGQTNLVSGSIWIQGDFTQQGVDTGFSPSATTVYLGNDTDPVQQTVTFEDPGLSLSHFAEVWIFEGADIVMGSEIYVSGTLTTMTGSTATTIRNPPEFVGRDIFVGGVRVDGLTLDGVHMVVDAPSPTMPVNFDNVVYQGFDLYDDHIQLSVYHPGDNGPFALSNVRFAPLAADNALGNYVEVLDADQGGNTILEITLDTEPGDGTNTKLGVDGTVYLSGIEIVSWP